MRNTTALVAAASRISCLAGLICVLALSPAWAKESVANPQMQRQVTVRLDAAATSDAQTGRIFFLLTNRDDVEPRQVTLLTAAYYFNNDSIMQYAPFFGQDVESLQPGAFVRMGNHAAGYPFRNLSDIPPGDYYVQAVLHRYEQVTPAHGKTIWLPMDDWEGTQFNQSPGNFYTEVKKLTVTAGQGFQVDLALSQRIPPAPVPADSEYVKHIKFNSKLASAFWGRDIPVGINVVLPKGYFEHPEARYPVVFHMGHFIESVPLHMPVTEPDETDGPPPEQSPRWLWEGWMAEDTPRFIAVTLLHPTPFYDDSYLVNSPNTGPWQDVFLQEMLPYLDQHFRTIAEPWARVMTGGSTGGWITLYTQITHPELFGGAWSYCPDMVDYRQLVGTNMYEEKNYYVPDGYQWLQPERTYSRTVEGSTTVTARQFGQLSAALGNRSRGGEWIDAYAAMFGPVGEDGYPIPLIDWETGAIDHSVIETWRDNGFDLRYYLEKNWAELGPKLQGQLYFLCGDMDQFYCNTAMYLMEDFLESTTNPPYDGSFRWGRPKVGHSFIKVGLDPWPFALLKEMATHIQSRSPAGFDNSQWLYR